jgi:hypothetical protein
VSDVLRGVDGAGSVFHGDDLAHFRLVGVADQHPLADGGEDSCAKPTAESC